MLLSERINDPDVREFFPQGFFTEEEDDGGLARGDKTLNWLQRPFRSIPQPIHWARNRERREWSMRYWRSLQRREDREEKRLATWRAERARMDAANQAHWKSAGYTKDVGTPLDLHEYQQRHPSIIVDMPMVHNRWALNCGKEYYLHLNGMRYTRLNREKLSQIVVSMHVQGYIKVDTGYYVLTRGRYERTIRFHDCTLNPNKAWVVSSVRD